MRLTESQSSQIVRDFGLQVDAIIRAEFASKGTFLKQTRFPRKTLETVLAGTGNPRVSTVFRLAHHLQVEPWRLFESSEEKSEEPRKSSSLFDFSHLPEPYSKYAELLFPAV